MRTITLHLVSALVAALAAVLIVCTSQAKAASPPVKYVGGAPCRTVKVGKGFFQKDGEFYRITHLTWCGKRVTVRVQAVTP